MTRIHKLTVHILLRCPVTKPGWFGHARVGTRVSREQYLTKCTFAVYTAHGEARPLVESRYCCIYEAVPGYQTGWLVRYTPPNTWYTRVAPKPNAFAAAKLCLVVLYISCVVEQRCFPIFCARHVIYILFFCMYDFQEYWCVLTYRMQGSADEHGAGRLLCPAPWWSED